MRVFTLGLCLMVLDLMGGYLRKSSADRTVKLWAWHLCWPCRTEGEKDQAWTNRQWEPAELISLSVSPSLSPSFLTRKRKQHLNWIKQMSGAKSLAHSRCSTKFMSVFLPFLRSRQTAPLPQPASPTVPTTLGLFVVIGLQQPMISTPTVLSVPQAVAVDGLGR